MESIEEALVKEFDELAVAHGESDQVSVVMTFHAEGGIAHWTLLGVERGRVVAERLGLQVQLVAVLDRADEHTQRVVESHPVLREGDRVLMSQHGDPGLARNHGIEQSSGDWIGILDGDDYCTANWIIESVRVLRNRSQVVVHTDYLLTFGGRWEMTRLTDQLSGGGSLETCFKHHLWASTVFARRELFVQCPYRQANMEYNGFGYEDWDWSLCVLAAGYKHTTAPGTVLFYRRKAAGSRQNLGLQQQVVVRPGPFFATTLWNRQVMK
ncbi:glycosyltransferase family A protein [Pseudomonas sp. PSE14]|uniref:glycosyltransferase family 2 protein n=1 Tax=Pseudomonas sp. PSE14 TaxID=3016341 RepID=UPI0023D8706A|nr:glycosyltransferase family A protein [Pseudomonas sp. PSE14]WEJ70758.1 glycosyltransferase family A protein [Pseudomonas sp. PSE14]